MNRDSPPQMHYQGLRKGGRSLALVAKLVQFGFLGLGLSIFLEQSRSLLSDVQFTWGERNIMGLIALLSLGGCGFAGWVVGRLISVAAEFFDAMADTAEAAWRMTDLIERQVVPTLAGSRRHSNSRATNGPSRRDTDRPSLENGLTPTWPRARPAHRFRLLPPRLPPTPPSRRSRPSSRRRRRSSVGRGDGDGSG